MVNQPSSKKDQKPQIKRNQIQIGSRKSPVSSPEPPVEEKDLFSGGVFGGGSDSAKQRMQTLIKLGTGSSLNRDSAEFNPQVSSHRNQLNFIQNSGLQSQIDTNHNWTPSSVGMQQKFVPSAINPRLGKIATSVGRSKQRGTSNSQDATSLKKSKK